MSLLFFFFNDTATTEIYTLSLHDALPICGQTDQAGGDAELGRGRCGRQLVRQLGQRGQIEVERERPDRKSTRLNSSHANISYAVFCLKKKKMYIGVRIEDNTLHRFQFYFS